MKIRIIEDSNSQRLEETVNNYLKHSGVDVKSINYSISTNNNNYGGVQIIHSILIVYDEKS